MAVNKRAAIASKHRDSVAAGILPRGDWRIRAVWGFLGLLALLLILRLADHQVLMNHAFLQKQGEARTVRTEKIQAHRGMITDRNGEPLAVSTPVVTLWANPKVIGTDLDKWRAIGHVMSWSEQELREKMAQYSDKEFMYLRRQISPAEAEMVLAQGIDGIYGQREYKRFYPAGEVVASLVGFTNIDDQGQEGVELEYNDALTGTAGKRRVIKDLKGRVVKDLGLQRPEQNGVDIALSIDLRLQYFAHTILKNTVEDFKAQGGSAVVVDVKTGEVLAMVSWPSYNPNNRTGIKPVQMRNRAIVDAFEPGSTMKPITMSAALESGKWRPEMVIDTNPGSINVQGKVLKDHRNYGVIDLKTVIAKSSQVGTSKIALSMDPNFVRSVFHRFGLGQATGVGFPGESTGVLPSYQRWRDLDRVTMAFGYGVSVTTLQLAHVYSIFANDGVKMPLSILRRDTDVSGERVLGNKVAREIVPMLEAVTQAGGTATRAQVPGFRVGGKTGTVHKLDARGYSPNRYSAVFAGIAPVSEPRYAMAVMIDEPSNGQYYGGEAAAPVFSHLMQGVLQLMGAVPDALPTQEAKPQTVDKAKTEKMTVKGAAA
ncbi:MAG TPA: penicillin-binding transpeptidase domain-containing protein [Pseudomonadales bacterium]|jgi:cell division protein FtsI (penicillin-binding protein 3)|nr:penicillin-binding transpeptidase domain-containing protein [Pseudomonadales bacterium]